MTFKVFFFLVCEKCFDFWPFLFFFWQGHVKMVLTASFSQSGSVLATGSDDNSVRVWDLRRRAALASLAAHTGCVSHVQWVQGGDVLLSASWDGSVRLWAARELSPIVSLLAQERVAMCDLSSAGLLASVASDKTVRLWK